MYIFHLLFIFLNKNKIGIFTFILLTTYLGGRIRNNAMEKKFIPCWEFNKRERNEIVLNSTNTNNRSLKPSRLGKRNKTIVEYKGSSIRPANTPPLVGFASVAC